MYTVADLDAAVNVAWGRQNAWYDSAGWEHVAWNDREHDLPGIGTLRMVENHDEEFETQCWLIVSVIDEYGMMRLFRRNGWRASHDGSYLDGPTLEVKAVTKIVTVTEWEPV